jgi:TPR repeat protein
MTTLGWMYWKGLGGVAQDYVKAREWFQKAADAGDIPAMVNLGVLYGNGQGGAWAYAKAREWFQKECRDRQRGCHEQVGRTV